VADAIGTTFARRHDRVEHTSGVAAARRPALEWGLSFGTTVGNLSTGASLFVATASEADCEM
jgi:hypothetical protein